MNRFNLLILFLLLVVKTSVQANDPFQIYSGYNGTPKTFCFQPEKVAPEAILVGNSVPDGFKISITNYKNGEDTLFCSGSVGAVKADWNANGSLILSGAVSLQEYQDAIRNVYYNNYSKNPTIEIRNITITLDDVYYLPVTGHFYQYILQPGIKWTEARDAAALKKLYGDLQGYLATITSKIENDFIWSKTKGTGWIGASDKEVSDEWKWVSGPEAGLLFWKGKGKDEGGAPVNGAYSNWNTGEPNDKEGEYYAHITFGVGYPGSWNDLPDMGIPDPSSEYYPKGYLIEYGGMEPATTLKLFDFVEIDIVDFQFSDVTDATICQFDSVELNHDFTGEYDWQPVEGLNNRNIANPVASPMQTTVYTVNATIGTCILSKNFTVNVIPAPIVAIVGNTDICEGTISSLQAIPGASASIYTYLWNTGETTANINVQEEKWYNVLTDNGECTYRDSVFVNVHEYPQYSLQTTDTLLCGSKTVQLGITSTDNDVVWKAEDPTMSIADPLKMSTLVSVPDFGEYRVFVDLANQYGCTISDTLEIGFQPVPTAELDIKPDSCYDDTLSVNYVGTASSMAQYYWNLTDLNPNEIIENPGNAFGPVKLSLTEKPTGKIGFYVISEYNCKSDEIEVSFKRKPWVSLDADRYEGCPVLDVDFTLQPKDTIDKLSYQWNFGDDQWIAGVDKMSHLFSMPDTSYPVRVAIQSETTGCPDTIRSPYDIQVYPIPTADFSPDPVEVSIVDPEITFNNSPQNETRYYWDFGDNSGISDLVNPTYTYDTLGYFYVRLIAENEYSCRDSAFHQVTVRFEKIFPANAFSPNSSNPENRTFLVYAPGVMAEGYHLLIFNRWGQTIFECKNEHKAWDGRMKNGQAAPAGLYIWVVNYLDFTSKSHQQNGTVSLIY